MAVHAARLPPAFKNSCIDGRLDIIMSREEHDLLQTIARSSPAAIMPAPTVPATAAARRDALGAGAGVGAGVGEAVGDVVGAGAGVFAEVLGTAAHTQDGQRGLHLLHLGRMAYGCLTLVRPSAWAAASAHYWFGAPQDTGHPHLWLTEAVVRLPELGPELGRQAH